ncbi:SDR family oxidoreductase [Roseomonas eburnea]|uniref:SDR family oxidoreductase n=1 Tax=Neoroseomonas eburnea TaxID=1346889 RepID=A0A9X9X8Q4_9PROT|nr:DoxX-like family protein [Neoroseomonas eburnea]MBR0680090.1 SDR family oxidoreductase [Neoroseomonas eburnea]
MASAPPEARGDAPPRSAPLTVLVLGAYGLVGAVVADRLAAAGHRVTGIGRQVEAARRARPHVDWKAQDIARLGRAEDWAPLLVGVDAVVNCAGALQDGARDDVQAVQSVAMRALFEACDAARMGCVVQVSAVGAAADASTAFMRSKAEADAALARAACPWVVLRPGLVLAQQAYGGTALLRALAAWPGPVPLPLVGAEVQTVPVGVVADAVLDAVEGRLALRATYNLLEDRPHRLADCVAALRAWLGRPPARSLPAPFALARMLAWGGDLLGLLGWRPPLRSTSLAELARGVRGDPEPWAQATGRRVPALAETLAAMPATVQEKWFGRLWLLRPAMIAVLSVFWAASGIVALLRPAEAAAVLTARAVPEAFAVAAVLLGAAADLALAVLMLHRRTMPFAARGMVAVTLAYLAGGSLLAPDLWLDPLGPLLKPIPAMLPALVLLATEEER